MMIYRGKVGAVPCLYCARPSFFALIHGDSVGQPLPDFFAPLEIYNGIWMVQPTTLGGEAHLDRGPSSSAGVHRFTVYFVCE